jgi:hypothetical protein
MVYLCSVYDRELNWTTRSIIDLFVMDILGNFEEILEAIADLCIRPMADLCIIPMADLCIRPMADLCIRPMAGL